MKKILSLLYFLIFIFPAYPQQYHQLLDPKTRDLIHEELSGELAKEYTIHISRYHRIQGSRDYRASAHYVLEMLRSFGFSEEDAYIESFPSDGKVHYQTWQSPSGWDMESAELRMLEPYEERIVGFPEIPMSLITYSNPGDVTAELVWVGSGTRDSDYTGKDVKDKFVLATGYGGSVHRLAVLKYGAKAVVCYLDDNRAKEHPDMLAYTGMWPTSNELDRVTFGFNLTNRQGEKLRDLLESGEKVVLRGWAKGIGLEPYFMDVVVAHIRGSQNPNQEFLFTAHLDHPKESANDNASGSAALLDICRSLTELVKQERISQPMRSIRFIWVPEFYGSMAYVDAHPEVMGDQFLGSVNLDMVGENLELLHSKMIITRTPYSIPSVFNDVVANMAKMVDRMNVRTPRGSLSQFNYRITPYSGGSDHGVFNDRKIPSVMLVHDDYTHHTSEDTPDKVDPVEIERAEIIGTGTVLYLSDLTSDQAEELTFLVAANSSYRLGQAGQKALAYISGTNRDPEIAFTEAINTIDYALRWEQKTVKSILLYNESKEVRALTEQVISQLESEYQNLAKRISHVAETNGMRQIMDTKTENKQDNRIPIRLTRGPINSGIYATKLTADELSWYQENGSYLNGNVQYEIANFMDGIRTVSEIRNAVSAEFFPVETEIVAHFIEDLVKMELVEWMK